MHLCNPAMYVEENKRLCYETQIKFWRLMTSKISSTDPVGFNPNLSTQKTNPTKEETASRAEQLFFTISKEDQFLDSFYRQGVTTETGRIKPGYDFQLPELDFKSIDSIRSLLHKELIVKGINCDIPEFTIKLNEILLHLMNKMGYPNDTIKFYGRGLQESLSYEYRLLVFHRFCERYHVKLDDSFIIPHSKEAIEKSDFSTHPIPPTEKLCTQLMDTDLIDCFYNKIPKDKIDPLEILRFYKRMKKEEVVKIVERKHFIGWVRLNYLFKIKDICSSPNAKLMKNLFYTRGFGNENHKVDISSFVSAARYGFFPCDSLAICINRLVAQDKNISLSPFINKGWEFQCFHDINGELITTLDGIAYEDSDWLRLIHSESKGKRCLEKNTEANFLDFIFSNAKKNKTDLGVYLAKILKSMLRHQCHNSDERVAFIFRASYSLLLKGEVYYPEIAFLWQEMGKYMERLENVTFHCQILKSVFEAIQNGVPFIDVLAQLTLSSYICINMPKKSEEANVYATNGTIPIIKIKFSTCALQLPFKPDWALEHLTKTEYKTELRAIHDTFKSLISVQVSQSQLKPYCNHPSNRLAETKAAVLHLLKSSQVHLKDIAEQVASSCLSQLFDPEFVCDLLQYYFKGLLHGSFLPLLPNYNEQSYLNSFALDVSRLKPVPQNAVDLIKRLFQNHSVDLAFKLYKGVSSTLPQTMHEQLMIDAIQHFLSRSMDVQALSWLIIANKDTNISTIAKLKATALIAESKVISQNEIAIQLNLIISESLSISTKEYKTLILEAASYLLSQNDMTFSNELLKMSIMKYAIDVDPNSANLWKLQIEKILKTPFGFVKAYQWYKEGKKLNLWNHLDEPHHQVLCQNIADSAASIHGDGFSHQVLESIRKDHMDEKFEKAISQKFLESLKIHHVADYLDFTQTNPLYHNELEEKFVEAVFNAFEQLNSRLMPKFIDTLIKYRPQLRCEKYINDKILAVMKSQDCFSHMKTCEDLALRLDAEKRYQDLFVLLTMEKVSITDPCAFLNAALRYLQSNPIELVELFLEKFATQTEKQVDAVAEIYTLLIRKARQEGLIITAKRWIERLKVIKDDGETSILIMDNAADLIERSFITLGLAQLKLLNTQIDQEQTRWESLMTIALKRLPIKQTANCFLEHRVYRYISKGNLVNDIIKQLIYNDQIQVKGENIEIAFQIIDKVEFDDNTIWLDLILLGLQSQHRSVNRATFHSLVQATKSHHKQISDNALITSWRLALEDISNIDLKDLLAAIKMDFFITLVNRTKSNKEIFKPLITSVSQKLEGERKKQDLAKAFAIAACNLAIDNVVRNDAQLSIKLCQIYVFTNNLKYISSAVQLLTSMIGQDRIQKSAFGNILDGILTFMIKSKKPDQNKEELLKMLQSFKTYPGCIFIALQYLYIYKGEYIEEKMNCLNQMAQNEKMEQIKQYNTVVTAIMHELANTWGYQEFIKTLLRDPNIKEALTTNALRNLRAEAIVCVKAPGDDREDEPDPERTREIQREKRKRFLSKKKEHIIVARWQERSELQVRELNEEMKALKKDALKCAQGCAFNIAVFAIGLFASSFFIFSYHVLLKPQYD